MRSPITGWEIFPSADPTIETVETNLVPFSREVRARTLMGARMFGDKMPEQEILIRNASAHGIGAVATKLMPEIGEAVFVTLPDGEEISGIVRWRNGKSFGVQLDEMLNLELLKHSTHQRNETLARSIDWMVDLHFNPPKDKEAQIDPETLRRL